MLIISLLANITTSNKIAKIGLNHNFYVCLKWNEKQIDVKCFKSITSPIINNYKLMAIKWKEIAIEFKGNEKQLWVKIYAVFENKRLNIIKSYIWLSITNYVRINKKIC